MSSKDNLHKVSVVICDIQRDFCDGELATPGFDIMMKNVKELVSRKEVNLIYTAFNHPMDHKSFRVNGGIWEPHCIKDTEGSEILKNAYKKGSTIIYKGEDPEDISPTIDINLDDSEVILVCGMNLEGVVTEQAIRLKDKYPKKNIYIIEDCSTFDWEDDWDSNTDLLIEKNIKVINNSDIDYLMITPIKEDKVSDINICKRCSSKLYDILVSLGVYPKD